MNTGENSKTFYRKYYGDNLVTLGYDSYDNKYYVLLNHTGARFKNRSDAETLLAQVIAGLLPRQVSKPGENMLLDMPDCGYL